MSKVVLDDGQIVDRNQIINNLIFGYFGELQDDEIKTDEIPDKMSARGIGRGIYSDFWSMLIEIMYCSPVDN